MVLYPRGDDMKQNQSRVFKIREQLRNIHYGAKGFVLLKTSKKSKIMNKKFKERIMLAITEVNGCTMCSYVHTKIALSSGMPRENIQAILSGDTSCVPVDEAVGVIFGQHFADSLETPSKESIERLVEEYGFKKAELILAACNMITMTNGMGTSMDYLFNRIKFKKNKKSNILLEICNPLFTMILFPVFVVYNYLISLFTHVRLLGKAYQFQTE